MQGGELRLSANVQNLFDKDPPVTPTVFDSSLGQTGNQVNASLFDLLGRRYTIGVTFRH
jgi:iron complex outermembrane recepter protein